MYQKTQEWIYRHARPLDIARWQYHFENGSKDNVIKALSFYQNNDGGFGHALEPDSWNPNSAPIQTWVATEILREIEVTDQSCSVVQGILKYLASGADFNDHSWSNTVLSNNDYPHAPWWHAESESSCKTDYNPTACLAGFGLVFAKKNSQVYKICKRIAQEATEAYLKGGLLDDMHTVLCYIRLMEYCEKIDEQVIDLEALKTKLREQVSYSITKDTSIWETSYICRPSQFFNSRDSIFYETNQKVAEYECEYILKTQLDDGSWDIVWSWNNYPEEWAISKNWWKANSTILNYLYLRGFERV